MACRCFFVGGNVLVEEHFPCYNVVVSAEIQKNVYVLGGGIYEKKKYEGAGCGLSLIHI